MAKVRHIHYWPGKDAGREVFEVEIEATFPDAVDEARKQVTRMYRDVCEDPAPDPTAELVEDETDASAD